MFGIQSVASKRFFKYTETVKDGLHGFMWSRESNYPFSNEETANRAVIMYKLRDIYVIQPINRTEDRITRVDRNIDFIAETRAKARKFGMKSVGIKSIDRMLDNDINHIPRVLVKNNKESYKCRIQGYWYEVLFEHVSKGKIQVLGFKFTEEANLKDRIAFIEMSKDQVLKLSIGVNGNTYSDVGDDVDDHSVVTVERKEYEITNPQCFLQGVNKLDVSIVKDGEPTVIKRKPYSPMRTMLCYMNDWYTIKYEHTTPGHVMIHTYKKDGYNPAFDSTVVIPIIHPRKGIHKINIIKWGTGHKPDVTLIVDNMHSIMKGFK